MKGHRTMRSRRYRFAAPAAPLAVTLLLACGGIRDRDHMPCEARCRYDYQYCHEDRRPDAIRITVPLHPGKGHAAGESGISGDYCNEHYLKCLRSCRAPSPVNPHKRLQK
ncbi:MAG: hypothetical protein JXA20_05575 [Spirochaetes bacterium]|nr:hypothetical protein [Spirochaetota bacterium]